MKTSLSLWTGFALAAVVMLSGHPTICSGQQGGYGGRPGSALPGLFTPAGKQDVLSPPLMAAGKKSSQTAKASNREQPNKDILVTPEVGEWMICVASYVGDDAHRMARQMVAELRGPNYKLPAYVFNYGEEERRKEEERVEKIRQQNREFLKSQGVTQPVKIRVPIVPVKEQTAVLIGGYRDMATARRALDELRDKMKTPDPSRVHLDKHYVAHKDPKTGQIVHKEEYINPFKDGFVVRNPSLPSIEAEHEDIMDINVLRRLNAYEEYSLLKCPKKVTLAIKEIRLPTIVQDDRTNETFWTKLGFGSNSNTNDNVAKSAHSLAEYLRKTKNLEAYVLHTKYSSVITVGGFDSVKDPRIPVVAQRIAEAQQELAQQVARVQGNQGYDPLRFFVTPQPMLVPR